MTLGQAMTSANWISMASIVVGVIAVPLITWGVRMLWSVARVLERVLTRMDAYDEQHQCHWDHQQRTDVTLNAHGERIARIEGAGKQQRGT
jgi:hypothetical protein